MDKWCTQQASTSVRTSPRGIREAYLTYVPDLSKPAPSCSPDEIFRQKTASEDGRFQMGCLSVREVHVPTRHKAAGQNSHCHGALPTNCSLLWAAISRLRLASASPASQHVIGAEHGVQATPVIKLLCYGTRVCLSPRRRPPWQ